MELFHSGLTQHSHTFATEAMRCLTLKSSGHVIRIWIYCEAIAAFKYSFSSYIGRRTEINQEIPGYASDPDRPLASLEQ